MPVGSTLGAQCVLLPSDFNVYCNVIPSNSKDSQFVNYPPLPFRQADNVIDQYTKKIEDANLLQILSKLNISFDDAHDIELKTHDQANNSDWFIYRQNRFTASQCNKLGVKTPKTARGLKPLAHNIVNGDKKQLSNNIIQQKLAYGRYYEPIAIQSYEKYMKIKGHVLVVEPCGLVIDNVNYVLGATPDGKVFINGEFGIIEVKCSEQYRDVDPKDICFIAKKPMHNIYKDGKIKINIL